MIRKATEEDLSRVAEIFVFNNRINYFPIFKQEEYSFGELQVVSMIDHYFGKGGKGSKAAESEAESASCTVSLSVYFSSSVI